MFYVSIDAQAVLFLVELEDILDVAGFFAGKDDNVFKQFISFFIVPDIYFLYYVLAKPG